MKQIVNRKAKFEYHFVRGYEAGIMLTGTEVKSLRNGNANLSDAYCLFINDELYIKSMYIGEYEYGNIANHETRRDRKLLLKKAELKKINAKTKEKGFTIIPYKVFLSDRNLFKVEIFTASGKKSFDKSHQIKEKDAKRELERSKKFNQL